MCILLGLLSIVAEARPSRAAEQLDLRRAGHVAVCDGEKPLAWQAFQIASRERQVFLQRATTTCTMSIDIPPDAVLSFGLAAGGGAGKNLRVRVEARMGDERHPLFDGKAIPSWTESQVQVPNGTRGLVFTVSGSGTAAWADLRLTTDAKSFEPSLPWTTDAATAVGSYLRAVEPSGASRPSRRLLVIGVDGASWKQMARLLERGRMPALAALRARGKWGNLRPPVPESAVSWTTMQTGVGPGTHGVFTFLHPSTQRRSFWHFLGDRELRSVVVGLPKASPRRPLEGYFVAGWTAPSKGQITWPSGFAEAVRRAGHDPTPVREHDITAYLAHMESRTEVARQLLRGTSWSLAFVVYEHSDTVGHFFGLATSAWNTVYQAIDRQIATLVEEAGPDAAVLVVSDHGWNSYGLWVNFASWLPSHGYPEWSVGAPAGANMISLHRDDAENLPTDALDAEVDRLQARVSKLVSPLSKQKVVKRVRRSGDVFPGPLSHQTPGQLVVELDHCCLAYVLDEQEKSFGVGRKDHHSWDGIYLLAGPGVAAGRGGPRVVRDVAPTVLEFFGIAPPESWKGTSLGATAPGTLVPAGTLTFESPEPVTPSAENSEEMKERLRALGYLE